METIKKAALGKQPEQKDSVSIVTQRKSSVEYSLTDQLQLIPVELKQRNQWVVWRSEQRHGRTTKVPYTAIGKLASSTDPKTWLSFQDACDTYKRSGGDFSGTGYVFSEHDPFTGIDLDKCVNEGVLSDASKAVVEELNSYTEFSQSKTGLHVIVKAEVPGERKRNGNIEMYDTARFFCVTGDHLSYTPSTIEERQLELNTIYNRVFNRPKELQKKTATDATSIMADEEIINLAAKAKNNGKFVALYSGDCTGYDSQSEADMALCSLLAFYTKDKAQIDRIFRCSGLYREKWEQRDEYGVGTIAKALRTNTKQYQKGFNGGNSLTSVARDYCGWKEALEATGRYEINDSGDLCHKRYNRHGEIELLPLCNFVARSTREIMEDDGIESRMTFEIEGILAGGRPLPMVKVPADKFLSLGWISQYWGMQANMEPGTTVREKVRHAIQMLSNGIERVVSYTHLGWRKINRSWVYLHAGGAVGASGVEVDVERESLQRYALPDRTDDLSTAIECTFDALQVADKSLTYALLAMVGLAPLCEPLRQAGEEPSFILWILGESGTRKSSVAALFLNHFGHFPNGKTLPASFKDTANALEKKAFITKDSILVVDDYHPKATVQETKQMEQLAQQLLRGYGDRHGRSRMKQDTTLRQAYVPRGLCIVTGEDVPKAGTSTTSRYIAVEVDKNSVNLAKLCELQNNADMFSHSMRGYLEWLAPQMDELTKLLPDIFKKTRELVTRSDQHGRIPETVAHLYNGLMMFTGYAEDKGVLTEQQRDSMLKEGLDIFLNLANRHEASIVEDKPVTMFLNALQELLTTDKVSVARTQAPMEKAGFGELIGYNDDEYYYLLPETTMNAVTQFFQKQNKTFSLSKEMLLKQLENEDLILVRQGKEKTERTPGKRISGRLQRVIWLKKNALVLQSTDGELG
jgi:hypothetical protein